MLPYISLDIGQHRVKPTILRASEVDAPCKLQYAWTRAAV